MSHSLKFILSLKYEHGNICLGSYLTRWNVKIKALYDIFYRKDNFTTGSAITQIFRTPQCSFLYA